MTKAGESDWRLHNTRLLLKHYRDLKDRCEAGIYDSRMLDQRTEFEKIEDMMQGRDVDVLLESTYRSVLRTRTLVEDVDRMMECFKRDSSTGDPVAKRRYQVIKARYINKTPASVKDLSQKYSVSTRTIQTDIQVTLAQLSAKYFGIDGIHFCESKSDD